MSIFTGPRDLGFTKFSFWVTWTESSELTIHPFWSLPSRAKAQILRSPSVSRLPRGFRRCRSVILIKSGDVQNTEDETSGLHPGTIDLLEKIGLLHTEQ